VLIGSMMREGFSPTIDALATLLLVGMLLAAIVGERPAPRQPRVATAPREPLDEGVERVGVV
jgi:ABC-type spermidine/putrescine transport system permease subunit II